jgi:hypothetical protein
VCSTCREPSCPSRHKKWEASLSWINRGIDDHGNDGFLVAVGDDVGGSGSGRAHHGGGDQHPAKIGVIAKRPQSTSQPLSHFIDRALYLPKGWTDDPARLKATYVQGDIGFSTKPQLAAEMIERALAAGVPFRWVAADSVYGVGDIERDLRQAGKAMYSASIPIISWGKPQRVVGTAEEIAKTQRRSDAGRWAPVRTSTAAPPLRC